MAQSGARAVDLRARSSARVVDLPARSFDLALPDVAPPLRIVVENIHFYRAAWNADAVLR